MTKYLFCNFLRLYIYGNRKIPKTYIFVFKKMLKNQFTLNCTILSSLKWRRIGFWECEDSFLLIKCHLLTHPLPLCNGNLLFHCYLHGEIFASVFYGTLPYCRVLYLTGQWLSRAVQVATNCSSYQSKLQRRRASKMKMQSVVRHISALFLVSLVPRTEAKGFFIFICYPVRLCSWWQILLMVLSILGTLLCCVGACCKNPCKNHCKTRNSIGIQDETGRVGSPHNQNNMDSRV